MSSFTRDQLHVITPLSNPERFERRYELYEHFEREIREHGAHLVTVEAAFGDRRHHVTVPKNPDHIQLRSSHEIWLKENLINVGISRLPEDWEYVAWVDADIHFAHPDWVEETIHQLQHFDIVQMFQTAVELGPTGEAFRTYNGFGYSFAEQLPEFIAGHDIKSFETEVERVSRDERFRKGEDTPEDRVARECSRNCRRCLVPSGYPAQGSYWHSGYAWACRREAFEALGGLMDHAILGAADHHMAMALVGRARESVPRFVHNNYRQMVLQWEDRANIHIRQNVGYVPGTILHRWHGKKADRKYLDRWNIIQKHNFDPMVDVKRDSQGLYQLSHQGLRMKNDIRAYFRNRNEDSIDNE